MGFGVRSRGRVLLGANLGRAIITKGDFTAPWETFAATRPFSQITLGILVIIRNIRSRLKYIVLLTGPTARHVVAMSLWLGGHAGDLWPNSEKYGVCLLYTSPSPRDS